MIDQFSRAYDGESVKRRAGRKPLDATDPSRQLTISLQSKQLDDYCRRALREGVSVPEIIRRELRDAITDKTSR